VRFSREGPKPPTDQSIIKGKHFPHLPIEALPQSEQRPRRPTDPPLRAPPVLQPLGRHGLLPASASSYPPLREAGLQSLAVPRGTAPILSHMEGS
jgi:hypothetical protein